MRKIKLITMTAAKPEMFEEKVNELLDVLDKDPRIESSDYDIFFADGTLLAVVNINFKRK